MNNQNTSRQGTSEEKPNDPFDLDQSFALYLKRVELEPSVISELQLKELKRAFVGGYGDLLMTMIFEIADIPDDEGAEKLYRALDQVSDFWMGEVSYIGAEIKEKVAKAIEFALK